MGLEVNTELLSLLFSEEVFMGKLRDACVEEGADAAKGMLKEHLAKFGMEVEIEGLSLAEGYEKEEVEFVKMSEQNMEESEEEGEEQDEFLDRLALLEDDNEEVNTTTG